MLLRFILLAISPPCSEVYTLHELRIEWSHSRCRRLRDASAVREMPADALARQAAAREAKRRREEASTQRRASWRTRSRACLPRARLGGARSEADTPRYLALRISTGVDLTLTKC